MRATIVTMTSELAKDYLSRNTQNRNVKKRVLSFYKKQMRSGSWKENGEPIIIDKNGIVKDGQHRLMAVAETGYAYRVPVISGVSPDVMDTIDTGTNRSAGDVLHLEGFKNATKLASIIKAILLGKITTEAASSVQISNNDILNFAMEKKSYLEEIMKSTVEIYHLQVTMVLSTTDIGYYIYTYGNTDEVKTFLKMISGSIREPKTATDYVYKKLYHSKTGESRLSKTQKSDYIAKAYLKYTQGNPVVRSLIIK